MVPRTVPRKGRRYLEVIDRDRYLTVGWNNGLTALLGLPALGYAAVALGTSVLSDRAAFIGLTAVGAVY